MIYLLLVLLNALGIQAWLPECLITRVSGYECYGCGLNRAAIQLIRLNFIEAYEANPLIYIYVPAICAWITYDFHKFRRNQKRTYNE